jgi:predicted ATPase
LRLAGWKSIRDATIELRPLNVLIGANAAGKSNLVSFFKLMNGAGGVRNRFLNSGNGSVHPHSILSPVYTRQDFLLVDLRRIFTLSVELVREFAIMQRQRVRSLPPYWEHLSQAFARFFMRVGLPVDIAPFK